MRAVALAAAICAAAASTAAAQAPLPALVDRDLTAGAGAALVTAAGAALARAEDVVVPHRLLAERGALNRTANVAFRLLKLSWFDRPQEHLLLVANHEVFGHGARLRERFDGPIGYRIHAPPPYGRGGASTSFVFDREPSVYERLAVHAGGMEASGVAAALVADRAFAGRRMRPRDALRYLAFELDTLTYVWSTDPDEADGGHDVADFLEAYNRAAAAGGSGLLTRRALRRDAFAGLANPMLAYAAFGIGRYLATGANDLAVPALSLGGVRYLPMVRYRLAPFGTEWAVVNALGGRIRPTEIELRVGRSIRDTPWGLRVRRRELTTRGGWSVDGSVDVWRQPSPAATAGEPLLQAARTGVMVRGRVERPFVGTGGPTFIIEAGVKSAGFVAGEPLAGGLAVRAGVGIPLAP